MPPRVPRLVVRGAGVLGLVTTAGQSTRQADRSTLSPTSPITHHTQSTTHHNHGTMYREGFLGGATDREVGEESRGQDEGAIGGIWLMGNG